MLSDTLLEVVLRVIPECMLFVFSGYAFSKYRVQGKRYFLSSFLMSVIGYLIARLLPIEFGVSQILAIITCMALLVLINRIPVQKAIASAIGVMILGFITDIISVIIAAFVKGGDVVNVLKDKTLFDSLYTSQLERQLFGAVSLIIMAIVLMSIYFSAKKRGKLKDVSDGKSVE